MGDQVRLIRSHGVCAENQEDNTHVCVLDTIPTLVFKLARAETPGVITALSSEGTKESQSKRLELKSQRGCSDVLAVWSNACAQENSPLDASLQVAPQMWWIQI